MKREKGRCMECGSVAVAKNDLLCYSCATFLAVEFQADPLDDFILKNLFDEDKGED